MRIIKTAQIRENVVFINIQNNFMLLKLCLIFTIIIFSFSESTAMTLVDSKTSTLQEAINKASDFDTLLIIGHHKVDDLQVNKPLTLEGVDGSVIDGEERGQTITITANNVSIKNLTIMNSGRGHMRDYSAIRMIKVSNCIIENNRLINNFFGIHLEETTKSTISNNTVENDSRLDSQSKMGNGIHLWNSNNNEIINNTIKNHRDGIYLEFSNNNKINQNKSFNSARYGLHFMFSNNNLFINNNFRSNLGGVAVMYSENIEISRNKFSGHIKPGTSSLLLKEIKRSKISENNFRDNTISVHMDSTDEILFLKNTFTNNGIAIRILGSSYDNRFISNNFIANNFDITTNRADLSNKFSKNYWDKYVGYDTDKDNIGEVPYRPITLFSIILEKIPNSVLLLESYIVSLIDSIELYLPVLTHTQFIDLEPRISLERRFE